MRMTLATGGLCLLLAVPAQAADKPVNTIPDFPGGCSATPYGETCLHTFGGTPTRIPLPQGLTENCAGTRAQLYQLSTRLAAPVGAPVTLAKGECRDVVIDLPEVRETTIFRVALSNSKPIAELPDTLIAVYPRNILEPLQDWSFRHHLVVNDRDHRLTPLLDNRHIAYASDVLSSADNAAQQICVWVPRATTSDNDDPPFTCARLLVLHEKFPMLPYVRVDETSQQKRTDVFMPMLGALNDNPVVQTMFVTLIQSQL